MGGNVAVRVENGRVSLGLVTKRLQLVFEIGFKNATQNKLFRKMDSQLKFGI